MSELEQLRAKVAELEAKKGVGPKTWRQMSPEERAVISKAEDAHKFSSCFDGLHSSMGAAGKDFTKEELAGVLHALAADPKLWDLFSSAVRLCYTSGKKIFGDGSDL